MASDNIINDLENVSGGEGFGPNTCQICGSTNSLKEIYLELGFKYKRSDRTTKFEERVGNIVVCQSCINDGFSSYIASRYPGQIHSSTHYNILRYL